MSLDTHRTKQHTHTQANKAFHTYEGDISHRGVRISHIAWLERGYPVSNFDKITASEETKLYASTRARDISCLQLRALRQHGCWRRVRVLPSELCFQHGRWHTEQWAEVCIKNDGLRSEGAGASHSVSPSSVLALACSLLFVVHSCNIYETIET